MYDGVHLLGIDGVLFQIFQIDDLQRRFVRCFEDRLWGHPALVLWGMRDAAFPPYMLDHWRAILPQARVVELAEAGHWPHEEVPERVVDELKRFLTTMRPQRLDVDLRGNSWSAR